MTSFGKALKAVMQDKGMTQKQTAEVVGASKVSVSQWLSGRAVPKPERKRYIAQCLNLPEDYFAEKEAADKESGIRIVSVEDVAHQMHVDVVTIKKGLQQGVFPWGYAVKTSGNRWRYIINAKRFEQIEGIAIKEEGN